MNKYKNIVYYPAMSIAENASLNNVEEKDIRYFIRSRGIDRRDQERQPYIIKIREYLKEHPNATRKETADALGLGINTVRKYWSIAVTDGGSNQNSAKEARRTEREDKAITYLNSLPVEFIRKYLKDRMEMEKQKGRIEGKKIQEKELKYKINALIRTEHENTKRLEKNPSYLPAVTKSDLYKQEKDQYNVAEHYCIAFRRKEDLWKGIRMPFGNMNGGFEFMMHGVQFPTSEHAYIAAIFSDNTTEHITAQKELLANPNGRMAKKDVRQKFKKHERKDWAEYNVEWMLYCIWNKVNYSTEFRDLLMAIPQGSIIIEDTSYQHEVKPFDSPAFWGARNPQKKIFKDLAAKYVDSLKLKKGSEKYLNNLLWDYCNVGIYIGNNVMGKILTYVKQCLHKNIEPDINYALLKSKKIHLLGKLINIDAR